MLIHGAFNLTAEKAAKIVAGVLAEIVWSSSTDVDQIETIRDLYEDTSEREFALYVLAKTSQMHADCDTSPNFIMKADVIQMAYDMKRSEEITEKKVLENSLQKRFLPIFKSSKPTLSDEHFDIWRKPNNN